MKLLYKIKQEIGYYKVQFEAEDELEMVGIVKTLLKGQCDGKATNISVSVEFIEDEPEAETEAETEAEEDDDF